LKGELEQKEAEKQELCQMVETLIGQAEGGAVSESHQEQGVISS